MKKIPSLLCFALLAVVGLSGCKNESDRVAHDEVGEVRVFDEPVRRVASRSTSYESVPAPLPMQGKRVAQKRFQMIGEMDVD